MLGSHLRDGEHQEYVFEVRPSPKNPEYLWMGTARPTGKGTGDRYFMTNHEGVVYYRTSGPFEFNPECKPPPDALQVGQ